MKTPVRGRFAPTPSGYLHIGNALTAMLSWLQVRHLNGEFILRIEDLDRDRFNPSYLPIMLEDLKWLGIDWDEGPDVGGPYGPYRQNDRTQLYQEAYTALCERGLLYPCFCSRKDRRLAARAPHGLASEGPVYSGACRHLSDDERKERAKTKTPAWRMMIPDEVVSFDDLVLGQQTLPPGAGGDFVVLRADNVFSYQLAVVVDDARMRVTHVLRGDDLLDSTPRQIHLYRELDLQQPLFAHVPMLYGADGQRLAKRDKSLTLASLRSSGMLPERFIGYLAWLAGLIDEPKPVRVRDLIDDFDIARLARHPLRLPEDWSKAM